MQRCPSCGGENPDAANFCSTCAAPLPAADAGRRAVPRQERKFVTVVFCDLVGFTGRAEVMDPEDVRALLSAYHRHLRGELERHGGTVEKFIGDAVVAVFGAPTVHEDDAERAVRAAIAIRDWAGEQNDIEVRIAVNTGEAIVSVDADASAGEGLVAGDVINTAARIQVAAPVNGILVGEQTYRATRDAITYNEAEPVVARGKAQPVVVWEVASARGRPGAGAVPQVRSTFVGRERELGVLADAFERMRDDREPQLVTLIAVPGTGKSRLVYELSRIVDADPQLICWRQGQCLSYGDGVSFWALAEIVKAETGILESDGPDVAAIKLSESVRALLPPADVDWVERDLRPLIGLTEGNSGDRGRADAAFPAWQRFLEALAERGPCVLVIEDLHWADEGLLNFLDDFAAGCAGLPLLLVTTARPELLDRRPQWGGGKINATTLAIPPLSADDTARIVHALLATTALSATRQRQLLDRAGGNPLYAEEFARMLTEKGNQDDLAIPETVQGIIAARLDSLEPTVKRLLQDASVVGSTFWLGAVTSMGPAARGEVETSLRQLEQREFIRRERRSSVEGEVEYTFRHVLVRDAAYAQMPRAERAERHQRTAEWIASLGRADDHAELVAHHYLEAIQYAKAAGREVAHLAAAARTPLRDAGERALRLAAYPQAARYLGAALELMAPDDADRPEVMYRYGFARLSADSTGEETMAEAIDLLRSTGQPELAARAALLLTRFVWNRADSAAFDKWVHVVDELTAEFPDSIVRLEALVAQSGFSMVAGDYERAIQAATDALPLVAELGRPELHARALDVRGTSRCALGDAGGLEDCRRGIEIARAGGAVWELHHALNNMITGTVQLGRVQEVRPLLDEWKAAFDDVGGTHYSRQWYLVSASECAFFSGDWEDALTYIDQYRDGIPKGQLHYLESGALVTRAMIMRGRGRDPEALADAERALEVSRTVTDPQILVSVLCAHAATMLALGDKGRAVEEWAALMAFGEVLSNTLSQGDMVDFAWLAVDLDRREEALAVVEQCESPDWALIGRAILTGDPGTAIEVLTRMGRATSAAYTQLRAGGEHARAALRFYESVGATRFAQLASAALATTA
jgi:class 3 adenylate cyclase/tetratricopeptide (TPR) repeat protein